MGFSLSKAWKGIKGAAKKVARSVKKVSKKLMTLLPGGKELWRLGTKIGGKIVAGIGKVVDAIGPVGMMALSFVIPAMGPALSAMWGSFGAGAASMAASANAMVAGLGQVGSAIFNGANFVGGTLGAMGDAISQGASELMKGGKAAFQGLGKTGESFVSNVSQGFSKASDAFTTKMGEAFSGKAGTAAMDKAAGKAILDSSVANTMKAIGDTPQISPLQEIIDGQLIDARQVDPFGQPIQASAAPLAPDQLAAKADPFAVAEASAGEKLLDGATKVAKTAAGLLGGIGGEPGGAAAFGDSTAGRKFNVVSAAGQSEAITGFRGDNLFANLLQQARGGFA